VPRINPTASIRNQSTKPAWKPGRFAKDHITSPLACPRISASRGDLSSRITSVQREALSRSARHHQTPERVNPRETATRIKVTTETMMGTCRRCTPQRRTIRSIKMIKASETKSQNYYLYRQSSTIYTPARQYPGSLCRCIATPWITVRNPRATRCRYAS
jgi:hypothetical protein